MNNNTYIIGKFRTPIYFNENNNYGVYVFKVLETDDKVIKDNDNINNFITVTGIFPNINLESKYKLIGKVKNHPKYSFQYEVYVMENVMPTKKEEILEFLSSSLVKGCGKTFAKRIVDMYDDKALKIIKEDYTSLLRIKGMSEKKALTIYNSLLEIEKDETNINTLKKYGFSIEEASKIINKHTDEIESILEGNLYLLKDIFDFKKIDDIYILNFDKLSNLRIENCLINSMEVISFNEGSIYYYKDEIIRALNVLFNISISLEDFNNIINKLIKDDIVIKKEDRYYLKKYYDEEKDIAKRLYTISNGKVDIVKYVEDKIKDFEDKNHIIYNDDQIKAIKVGLNSNISIISGGPGTGKTTIIKAISSIYIEDKRLSNADIMANMVLLAPTGRASKRLKEATGLPAYTIHRFLKWHKDTNTFEYDENNKVCQSFIIVDESSMIDVSLMKSLLVALKDNSRLILVGDINQLPSVGPGLVLSDLIASDLFDFTNLTNIYRQSENSYIPFLAKDIKNQNIDDEFMYKRDDYNFVIASEEEIVPKILSSCKIALSKGINEDKLQVLAPMYKGINGINLLNEELQKIYNPSSKDKYEVKYGDITYRENDKVLELVNDADNNVFNGDIGKIVNIYTDLDKKLKIAIEFDLNKVVYEKKDLKNITHAYAISIHKAQGSEFEHVIMPMSKHYFIMLYNKLLYTGVSRAKKSLTIIGDPRSFTTGIMNNYAKERKTNLIENLKKEFGV